MHQCVVFNPYPFLSVIATFNYFPVYSRLYQIFQFLLTNYINYFNRKIKKDLCKKYCRCHLHCVCIYSRPSTFKCNIISYRTTTLYIGKRLLPFRSIFLIFSGLHSTKSFANSAQRDLLRT